MSGSKFKVLRIPVTLSDVIAVLALLVAGWAAWEARSARLASQPRPSVAVDFEAVDTRESQKGRCLYYFNWAVSNSGGSVGTRLRTSTGSVSPKNQI